MQELEKILEEIKKILEDNKVSELNSDGTIDKYAIDAKLAWDYIKDIIRKHMNNGWIPVEERMPENNKLVLVWARSTARGADEWSLGSYDNGFWALGSYGGSLVFPSQLEAVAWRPLPEPYRSVQNKTEASDWREDMLRKFDRRD